MAPGYGRTGTLSTYTALNQLGYPCYHMFEVIENKANKSHSPIFGTQLQTHRKLNTIGITFLKTTIAAVDNPACCVWKDLMKAYPDAKVILTLHPRGPRKCWYESTIDTIYFSETMWQFKLLKLVTPFARKMGNMSSKLIWQRSHKGTMANKPAAIALYQAHIEEVKALVPPEKLLIFTVNQGWEPLCKFLDVAVPQTEFPNVHDRAQIKKTIADLTKGAYVILGAGIICLAAILFAFVKFVM